MTDPRASAQKTDMQRLAVHVDTRRTDPVPQAKQQLALFQCQNVGTLLTWYIYANDTAMPMSLKSPETERLARTIAEATGETITEAITRALQERLQRLEAARSFTQYVMPIQRVQQRIRERPVLDARSADDVIGYDTDGAPT
jgi:antitoxin VapB